ncbi:MAG: hypothetical protein J3K34DRAFT_480586 [Monoraphidium minutum]|nr:MAG: hypothetical protein J3K34DRAFT_480586 [Monoraphidium minutum]
MEDQSMLDPAGDGGAAPLARRSEAAVPAPVPRELDDFYRAPRWASRDPTTQELLELSHRVYKHSRRLYSEADAQGLRVYHDERLDGSDVRVVMLVPSWFPRPHVPFASVAPRLEGDSVSIAVVVRGTVRDLVGNTIANLQLLFNKLIDEDYLPEAATDTTKVVQGWLLELMARHPELRPPGAVHDGAGPEWTEGGIGGGDGPKRRLRLSVSITGHSLGGLVAECATIESARFAAAYGMGWRCVSFESPGVPRHYHALAERLRPGPGAWEGAITGYLAAPNPINMLYPHLGTVVHVMSQWEQTWSHVARCIGADALRIAGWVAVASLTGAAINKVTGRRGSDDDDDDRPLALPPAATAVALPQPVIASALEAGPARAGRALSALPIASATAANGLLSRQSCLAVVPPRAAAAPAAALGGGEGSALVSAAAAAAAAALHGAASASAGAVARSGSVGGAVAAAASGAAQTALRHVGVGMPLGALAAWVMGGGGPLGLAKCLAGVLGVEVEELVNQHGLGSMRPCFDSNTGELHPRFCRRMAAWPHLGTRGEVMLKAVTQVARWTLPSFLCHDNVGVWTMLSRSALVEARCSRLEGYEPLASPDDVTFDHVYSIAPDEVMPPAVETAAAAAEPSAAAEGGAGAQGAGAARAAFGRRAGPSDVIEMAVLEGGGLPAVAVPAADAAAERALRADAIAALGAALAAERRRQEVTLRAGEPPGGAAAAAGGGPAPLEDCAPGGGGGAAAGGSDDWEDSHDGWEVVARARDSGRPRRRSGAGAGGGGSGASDAPSDLMEPEDDDLDRAEVGDLEMAEAAPEGGGARRRGAARRELALA